MQTVTDIQKKLEQHTETVSPGLPASLSSANSVGDGVWQGDLAIVVADSVPGDYELVENPTDTDRQLVPLGGGPGSHHRLKSLDGVKLYRPPGWGQDEADLRGPYVVFEKPNAIVHEPGHANPHGTVTIDDPMTVRCGYQRNYNAVLRAERRAAD